VNVIEVERVKIFKSFVEFFLWLILNLVIFTLRHMDRLSIMMKNVFWLRVDGDVLNYF
jgi:hypothetical protein